MKWVRLLLSSVPEAWSWSEAVSGQQLERIGELKAVLLENRENLENLENRSTSSSISGLRGASLTGDISYSTNQGDPIVKCNICRYTVRTNAIQLYNTY